METLHEASFYETLPDGRVRCTLCPHDCRIPDGARGACGVRVNLGGKLHTLDGENTCCPECGSTVITRFGCMLQSNRLREGRCADCGASPEGVWM